MNPELFSKAANLFMDYILEENISPIHRKGCPKLEKAVDKLHAMLKKDARHAWAYVGGRQGRALLRGGLLKLTEPSDTETWVKDWFKRYDDYGYSKYFQPNLEQ